MDFFPVLGSSSGNGGGNSPTGSTASSSGNGGGNSPTGSTASSSGNGGGNSPTGSTTSSSGRINSTFFLGQRRRQLRFPDRLDRFFLGQRRRQFPDRLDHFFLGQWRRQFPDRLDRFFLGQRGGKPAVLRFFLGRRGGNSPTGSTASSSGNGGGNSPTGSTASSSGGGGNSPTGSSLLPRAMAEAIPRPVQPLLPRAAAEAIPRPILRIRLYRCPPGVETPGSEEVAEAHRKILRQWRWRSSSPLQRKNSRRNVARRTKHWYSSRNGEFGTGKFASPVSSKLGNLDRFTFFLE